MKKVINILLCLLLILTVFTACNKTDTASNPDVASGEKELVIGELWDINSVDPINDGLLLTEKAMITEVLIGCDETFSITPEVAVKWENIDNNTWKISLREGVKYHDGSDLTAETVKWAMDFALQQNPTVKTKTKISKIDVTGDLELTLRTESPNSDLVENLHSSSMPIISPNSYDESGTLTKPIGTGAFKLDSFDEAKGEMKVSRFDDYWGGKANLDKITIKAYPDSNTRALAIEKGEVDFTCDVPYNEIERLDELDNVKVKVYDTPRIYQATLNLNSDLFKDVNVRHALSMSIDRETISEHVLYKCGSPALGPYTDNMAWQNSDLKGYGYDVKKAKDLLEKAGWKDSDGDGILDKDGKPFTFNLLTYSQRPGLPRIAEAMQANLKEIGIEINIQTMDYSAITQIVDDKGEWGMSLSANATTMIPTPTYYLYNFHSDNMAKYGYENADIDNLLAQYDTEFSTDKKYDISKELQQMVVDDSPVLFICNYGVSYAMNESISNFEFNPTAHDYMLNFDIDKK